MTGERNQRCQIISLAACVAHSPLERVELFARVLALFVSLSLLPHAGTAVGLATIRLAAGAT